MADESGEKTEQASGKKLEDARKKGQVAKSIEVNSAAILLFGIFALFVAGTMMMNQLTSMSSLVFRSAHTVDLNVDSVRQYLFIGILFLGTVLVPVMGVLMILGLASNIAQVGFMFSIEAIAPKFEKLNPITGLKKVFFSQRSGVELMKGLIKLALVGLVAYSALEKLIEDSVVLMDSDIAAIFGFMMRSAFSVSMKVAVAFLVVAVIDYFYQRYDFSKEMMMTKQEVKEETKMMEGDPMIKGHIRSMQRQMARKRMMQEVPKADVVITNPTHYAIALRYDPEQMAAPTVIAKGMNLVAQKIKEIAKEHDVPIVEDKPLARSLYKNTEIGDSIPADLFRAVAQILAYIYQMKNISRKRA